MRRRLILAVTLAGGLGACAGSHPTSSPAPAQPASASSKAAPEPKSAPAESAPPPPDKARVAPAEVAFARGWMASVQARASSRQFEDDQNLLPLGGYFTFDSYASAPLTHGLQMFLAVENVLNRQYLIGRTPTPLVAAPITGRIGLRLTWPKL